MKCIQCYIHLKHLVTPNIIQLGHTFFINYYINLSLSIYDNIIVMIVYSSKYFVVDLDKNEDCGMKISCNQNKIVMISTYTVALNQLIHLNT